MLKDMSAVSGPRFRIHSPLLSALRARFGKMLLWTLAALLPLFFFRACFITYVPPDEIGLRQIALGPAKGLQKTTVASGYRRQIRGFEQIRTFPRNVQVVEFTNSPTEQGAGLLTRPAIKVPTVDGYPVSVDVTVLYRIADPFNVVSRFGFGGGYEEGVVVRFTDPAVKQYLGELKAEEFYRDERQKRVNMLKRDLAAKFKLNGLQLADVLVRQYDYPDTFQSLTEQKKIQDQSVLSNRALTKQAEVQTRLNQVAAEGQNLINIKGSEYQAQITEIVARKELYERQKRAEADLLVKTAEANGTEMINRAMEGAGSSKLLRLRRGLALLNSIKGPIYITEDPTDLSKILTSN